MTETVDPQPTLFDCRESWAATITDVADHNSRIVVVVNDSVGSSKLGDFQFQFPDRTIDVGIAEQNMVGVGAGLANGGFIPFVSAAGCFLTARALEQIKVDAAYSEYNVKLVGQSPGVAYGDMGPTHHSIEDFAWLRTLPHFTVLSPASPKETEQVVRWAAEHEGPVYIRIPRMGIPEIYDEKYQFEAGKAALLRAGNDVTIIATGTTVTRALDAADVLASTGVDARVLSFPTIKPIDRAAIIAAAEETAGIVTVEEAFVNGLGGAVAEVVVETAPCLMKRIGFEEEFAVTGSAPWLLDQNGATPENIADSARSLMP